MTYIYPNVDEKTRTAQVRMEFHNPGYFLKPGMFATVKVVSELEPSALLIPDMAILRSGEKTTVFVALDGGKFDPRNVTLGPQAENDQYEVLSGVSEGERIVTSGQFMLDSESQLREAIQKMMEPRKTAGRPRGAGERPQAAPRQRQPRLRRGGQIHLPDAGAYLHRIRPSRQMPHLRHDAGAGVGGDVEETPARRARFSTTPARCPSTATCAPTSPASAPSAA